MKVIDENAGPSADLEEGFHQLRLSIKRLRAFCQLVRPNSPEAAERMTLHLKSIARTLSRGRDQQVITRWLKAHPKLQTGSRRREPQPTRARLNGARAEILSRSQDLRQLAKACEKHLSQRNLDRSLHRARTAWRQAERSRSAADFHRARRRLKDLQYQLEFLESPAPPLRDRLDELNSRLGEAHDAWLVELHAKSCGLPAAKIAQIRKERVKIEESALQVAKKLHLLKDLRPSR